MTALPDLIGWRAVVIHRPDEGTDRLVRQLGRLGLVASVRWQPLDLARTPADIVLVDADQGYDELLPWAAAAAPLPVVALLQSEAPPGRLRLARGAGAIIPKPIVAAAVYPARPRGLRPRRACGRGRAHRDAGGARPPAPLVHAAVTRLMTADGLTEDAAYRRLRAAAMNGGSRWSRWRARCWRG